MDIVPKREAAQPREGREDPPGARAATLAWTLLAGAVGAVAVVAYWLLPNAPWLAVAVHGASVTVSLVHLKRTRLAGRDTTYAALALVAVAALGPMGALGAAAITALAAVRQPESRLLEAWYSRIAHSIAVDPVTQFCDSVGSGRTMNLAAASPPAFAAVAAAGRLEDQQAMLSIIARRFHPAYLPALAAALRSQTAVIRVQAAAVAAHVRPRLTRLFRDEMTGLERHLSSPAAALDLLRRLDLMVEAGLLEEGDRRQGLAAIDRLGSIVLEGLERGEQLIPRALRPEDALACEGALDRLLVTRQRFATLRGVRSERRVLGQRPKARVRRLHARQAINARSA